MKKIKKENSLIILLASVVLLLISTTFLFSEDKTLSYETNRDNVIELRDYGFFPEEITITKGETVTFVTRRDIPFWPASNDHPAHEIYPEFDAKKAIVPGETWSFTFDKVGTWGFHDHLGAYYSTDRGVIHVVEKGKEVSKNAPLPSYERKRGCSNEEDVQKCWIGNLKATLLEDGLKESFELLSEYYEKDSEFASNCNDITHYMGGFAFRVFKDNKKDIVIPESVYCNAGFYHGFMEVWFHNYPDIKEAVDFCEYVENRLGEEKPHSIYACYHGLGHGAYHTYLISDWTDFAFQLQPVIEICEKTKYITSCLDGVFNAVSMDYYLARYRYLEEKENPLSFCDQLDKYRKDCYDGLVGIYLWGGEGEITNVLDVIRGIEDDELASAAMQTLVQIYSFKKISASDHSEIINTCYSLRETLWESCFEAYVMGLVEQGKPGEEYLGGFSFCSSDGLLQKEKDNCYYFTIDYSKTYYSQDERDKVCNPLSGKYKDYCLEQT